VAMDSACMRQCPGHGHKKNVTSSLQSSIAYLVDQVVSVLPRALKDHCEARRVQLIIVRDKVLPQVALVVAPGAPAPLQLPVRFMTCIRC
jgi:hypothetical protein